MPQAIVMAAVTAAVQTQVLAIAGATFWGVFAKTLAITALSGKCGRARLMNRWGGDVPR